MDKSRFRHSPFAFIYACVSGQVHKPSPNQLLNRRTVYVPPTVAAVPHCPIVVSSFCPIVHRQRACCALSRDRFTVFHFNLAQTPELSRLKALNYSEPRRSLGFESAYLTLQLHGEKKSIKYHAHAMKFSISISMKI